MFQVYLLNWCPWPLPCPEVLNYALGVDLLDTSAGCVLLATNTPTESQLVSDSGPTSVAECFPGISGPVAADDHSLVAANALRSVAGPLLSAQQQLPTLITSLVHKRAWVQRWSCEMAQYCMRRSVLELMAPSVNAAVQEGITTPEHPRTIRMTMHAGGFRFVPLPPDPSRPHVPRTEATVLLSFDAKKFVLPDAAISFILKIIAPLIYKSVHKVLDMMFHGKADRPSGGDGKSEAGQHTELLDRLGKRPEYAAVHKHCCKYVEGLKN